MNDLDELKSLLFGAEKQVLDSIQERVQKPETRVVDVADVLPEAVRMSHRQGKELVRNLRDPVGQCIKESFHAEPQEYADALYPVMGPAIRKSITQTLRAFAQQINQTVEQSVSARGLKWRFEAWRAGVPFGEYVVQKTLLYRIEQAYLISRENGLLIEHVHHDASRIKDSDAVSAMFTAIQDFVKESFSPDRTGRLETADMGDFTLWAVHGPHALLVCVIRGVPPRSVRTDLSAILERIHFRYGESLRVYSGDQASMGGVEDELRDCLELEELQVEEAGQRRPPVALIVLALALAATLAYFAWQRYELAGERARLLDGLNSAPGYFVAGVERDGRRFSVSGLRDPLAPPLSEIALTAGIDPARISADMRPFQSLEEQFRLQRAVESLAVPSTASVTVDGKVLRLSGTATREWLDRARSLTAVAIPDYEFDDSALQLAEIAALHDDVSRLASADFYFVEDARFRESDVQRLTNHAATIRDIADRARRLGLALEIIVTGHTDGLGAQEFNERLAQRRVDAAVQQLLRAGLDPQLIKPSIDVGAAGTAGALPTRRKVDVNLALSGPD
ncbi:MAG: OmpA family protein [Gammaproteobacteria bacterium]|nr:OmpA family protein [Gammaproteobacteria bacterium]